MTSHTPDTSYVTKPSKQAEICSRGGYIRRIYGGPQTATVSGTWSDQTVNSQYNMQGGCEIDRWRKAAPLIGDPEGGLRGT